jgi:hypothetical protein
MWKQGEKPMILRLFPYLPYPQTYPHYTQDKEGENCNKKVIYSVEFDVRFQEKTV